MLSRPVTGCQQRLYLMNFHLRGRRASLQLKQSRGCIWQRVWFRIWGRRGWSRPYARDRRRANRRRRLKGILFVSGRSNYMCKSSGCFKGPEGCSLEKAFGAGLSKRRMYIIALAVCSLDDHISQAGLVALLSILAFICADTNTLLLSHCIYQDSRSTIILHLGSQFK